MSKTPLRDCDVVVLVLYFLFEGYPPGIGDAGAFLNKLGAPDDEPNRDRLAMLCKAREHRFPAQYWATERIVADLMRWNGVRAEVAFHEAQAAGYIRTGTPQGVN